MQLRFVLLLVLIAHVATDQVTLQVLNASSSDAAFQQFQQILAEEGLQDGFVIETAVSEAVVEVLPCEQGYYCIDNAKIQCPPGTYGTFTGATSLADCTRCPAGTYQGNFGQTSQTACQTCPPGSMCPSEGAATFTSCEISVTYQPLSGQLACITCPPRSDCSLTSAALYAGQSCLAGYQCKGTAATPCAPYCGRSLPADDSTPRRPSAQARPFHFWARLELF
jgi:hypothetical protein